MIRELMHDPIFLSRKATLATQDDLPVAQDLLDTLTAHREGCVGMAANMIGVCKRIIVFDNEGSYMTMFNPVILKAAEPYDTEEGCLSLLGGPSSLQALSHHQSPMAKRAVPNPYQNFHRLDSTDHSA